MPARRMLHAECRHFKGVALLILPLGAARGFMGFVDQG